MKFNSPLPAPLPKECQKAAKIFHSFVDSSNNGLDGVVPRAVLDQAKGFAIFSVIKAGFVFSARAGSGIVIARLEDGSWSAPSAIGTGGLGVGGQAGAEVTDFLIVLNSRAAVKSFMAAGSLTLGGNLSVAVGPLGRNGEALGSLNTSGKIAAMYSYSKTRGLFGGVSLEGSVILERQDANSLAYQSYPGSGSNVSAKMLLSGAVPPPDWAMPLIKTLEQCTGLPGNRSWVKDEERPTSEDGYAFGGVGSPHAERPSMGARSLTPSFLKKSRRTQSAGAPAGFPPASWGTRKEGGAYFDDTTGSTNVNADNDVDEDGVPNRWGGPANRRSVPAQAKQTLGFDTHFDSDFRPEGDASSSHARKLSAEQRFPPVSAIQPGGGATPMGDLMSFDPLAPDPRSQAPAPAQIHNDFGGGFGSPLPRTGSGPPPGMNPFAGMTRQASQNVMDVRSALRDSGSSALAPVDTIPASSSSSSSDLYASSSPHSSYPAYPSSFSPSHGRKSSGMSQEDELYADREHEQRPRSASAGRRSEKRLSLKPDLTMPLPPGAVGRAIALYDFAAAEPGDLGFTTGQVIIILQKSNSTDDWWRGRLDGREGIFPANFVELA